MQNTNIVRRLSQAAILAGVFVLSLRHMNLGVEQAAPIDAYCPFGALEGVITYFSTGEFLNRIFISSFIIFGIFLLLTLFFGRVFCGYFCPLGAIQEWLRGLGRKIGIKKDLEVPRSVDKYLRYAKYLVLVAIMYFSWQAGDLVFRGYDPYNALMHLGEEFDEKVFGYSILAVIIAGSLFTKNLWCRYFCPLGAGFGILRKLSPFKLERAKTTCISCGTCDYVCPAGLNIKSAGTIKSADCVSCLNCVSNCPKNSLKIKIFGYELSKKIFSWLVIGIFFGALGIVIATPLWQTKRPSNILNSEGRVDFENIRGSNTLQYLIETTGISLETFQQELNLPMNVDTKLKLKEIGSKYQIKNTEGGFIEAEEFREVIKKNTDK